MKPIFLASFFLFLVLFFPSSVAGQSPPVQQVPTPTINIIQSVQNDIIQLNTKLEKLHDENYQKAITVADDAGKKADRLLNWLVGIATVFGVTFALVTFVIGGSLMSSLKELRTHVNAARKNALYVDAISKQAQEKKEELQKEIDEIKNKQEESKGKIQAQEKEIDSLISKAQGTISDINTLKNSATFISNASYPPYAGTAPMGFPWYGSNNPSPLKCDNCGNQINYAEHISNNVPYFSLGETLCLSCWKQKYGNG